MITRGSIICGLGTVCGYVLKNEPNKVHFAELELGSYFIGDKVSPQEAVENTKVTLEFNNLITPLKIYNLLDKAQKDGEYNRIINIGEICLDFTRADGEEAIEIVKSHFFNCAITMAQALEVDRNELARVMFETKSMVQGV